MAENLGDLKKFLAKKLYIHFSEIRVGANTEKWNKMRDERKQYWIGHANSLLLDIGRVFSSLREVELDYLIKTMMEESKEMDEILENGRKNREEKERRRAKNEN